MLSPPLSEPKKLPQQLVFHLQIPNFILLFLLRRHVSLWRSSPAAGRDSRFHFPHSPVIPFDPSPLLHICPENQNTPRFHDLFSLLLSSPAFFFYRLYMVLPYKIAPWRSYFSTSGDFSSMSVFLGSVHSVSGGFVRHILFQIAAQLRCTTAFTSGLSESNGHLKANE